MPTTKKTSKPLSRRECLTKARKGLIPPYLLDCDLINVVFQICRLDGQDIYGVAEPQCLHPQTDGEVIMDIYTRAELKKVIAERVYTPAWTWGGAVRLSHAWERRSQTKQKEGAR